MRGIETHSGDTILSIPPLLTADEIRAAGRRLPVPFRLRVFCSGRCEEIRCGEVLRIVPRRRIVCATQWDGTPAIAKILLQRWGANGSQRRELEGLSAMGSAGLPVPRVLATGVSAGRHPVLVLERLASAIDLGARLAQTRGPELRLKLLEGAVEFVARQHDAGLIQQDLHPGNMLWCRGAWYGIDGTTVKSTAGRRPASLKAGLDNLGIFLAQLPPTDDRLVEPLCRNYLRVRGGSLFPEDVARARRSQLAWRTRRMRTFLRKSTRDCTEFSRFVEGPLTVICRRADDTLALRQVLTSPDSAIAGGVCLKNGHSATAARVDVDGRSLVIKRYNLKRGGLARTLRFLAGPSRARRSWRTALFLRSAEIATPLPVAVMERRYGPVRTAAYFVTEYVSGDRGEDLFGRDDLTSAESARIAETTTSFLRRLYEAGIAHGDLNGRNFIYQGAQPVIIDLDAARWHRIGALLRHAHFRDCRRLLRNFTAPTRLYRELHARITGHLAQIFGEGEHSDSDRPAETPPSVATESATTVLDRPKKSAA